MGSARTIFIIGAVFMSISIFLPWLRLENNIYGYEMDGIFVGIVGIIALVIGLTYKNVRPQKPYFIWGLLGVITSCGLIYQLVHLLIVMTTNLNAIDMFNEVLGSGVLFASLGTLLLFVGSLLHTPKSIIDKENNSELPIAPKQ